MQRGSVSVGGSIVLFQQSLTLLVVGRVRNQSPHEPGDVVLYERSSGRRPYGICDRSDNRLLIIDRLCQEFE